MTDQPTHTLEHDGHELVVHDLTWADLRELAVVQGTEGTLIGVLDMVAHHIVSIDGEERWRSRLPVRVTGPLVRHVQDFFAGALRQPDDGDS